MPRLIYAWIRLLYLHMSCHVVCYNTVLPPKGRIELGEVPVVWWSSDIWVQQRLVMVVHIPSKHSIVCMVFTKNLI